MSDEKPQEMGALFAALAKAQGQMKGAIKDSANPFFKSKYADLSSVWEACREALAANGLSVVQFPVSEGELVGVRTILGHASGQSLESVFWVKPKANDPQGLGSAITYLRRYALAAAVGVAPEDDDGESAHGRGAEGKGDGSRGASNNPVGMGSLDRAPENGANRNATQTAQRAGESGSRDAGERPGPKPPAAHYEHDPVVMAKATRLLQQLGWAKPHAVNWLKKHFQADSFAKLTADQSVSAVEKMEMALEVALAEEEKAAAEAAQKKGTP